MAPRAVVWEMWGVQLPLCFRQHIDNLPSVTGPGRQNWGLFLVCGEIPLFFLFCFFNPKQRTEAACSCWWGWAGLQQGQHRVVVGLGQDPAPARAVCWAAQSCLWRSCCWGTGEGPVG